MSPHLLLVYLIIHIIRSQQILKPKLKPLQCPKNVYYAIVADNVEPYTINAQHPNNPFDTEYEWEIMATDGINLDEILINGENTETFWVVNENQYGELRIILTLQHITRSPTPCSIKLVFQPSPYFGIDLGTTFSCIGYQFPDINHQTNKRQTKLITADTSNKRQYCIPTAIYFPPNKDEKLLFGYAARHKLATDPQNVIYDVKRIIGRKWDDTEVQLFAQNHLFKITQDDENIQIVIPNRNNMKISPEQALGAIIRHLVAIALKEVNIITDTPANVVISIPAFFHNAQRRAIKSAAQLANVNVIQLVVEPTAAAIAHIYYSTVPADDLKLFLVFDYGGGTLDCSVMRCVGVDCKVLAVSGNSTLGGIDFDHVIKDIIISKLKEKYNINKKQIDEAILLEESELIKISLSTNDRHEYKYKDMPEIIITRKEFEKHPQTKKLLKYAIKTAKQTVKTNPKFKETNVRMILMIGGSSNIPIIRQKLLETFSRETLTMADPELDPQLMVITGSAVLAASILYDNTETQCIISDVIPLPLGFEVCYGTFGDSDEQCGMMGVIVEKNSAYPLVVNHSYCQYNPNHRESRLSLYEGEHEKVEKNHFLSELMVESLLPRKESKCIGPSFHAMFSIDNNGIATIYGIAHKEDGTDGKVYTMTLSLTARDGSLSRTQKKRMKSELESWLGITQKVKQKSKKQRKKEKQKSKQNGGVFSWFKEFFKEEL